MITSIFNWLNEIIANALDGFISLFVSSLDLSISAFLDTFPVFTQIYDVLQAVAIGFALVIAVIGLYTFFFDSTADAKGLKENPISILFKTFLAGGLIFFGGYILEAVVDIAKLSFNTFSDISVDVFSSEDMAGEFFGHLFSADGLMETLGPVSGLKATGASLLSLIFMLTIGWELVKLVVEVAERYLMVFVLVFTSPLVYPTIATKRTESIMKKWISMFVSSCILMSLSVIFLKLILSGLGTMSITEGGAEQYLLRMIMILAMCKIAQRVDTYMQQLGLSAPTTGGNLLDDVMAVSKGIGALGRTASNIASGKGPVSKVFGATPLGAMVNAGKGAVAAARAGGTGEEIAAAAKTGALKGMPIIGKQAAYQEGMQTGRKKADMLRQKGAVAEGTARAEAAKAMKDPQGYVAADTLHGSETAQQLQREKEAADKAQEELNKRITNPAMDGQKLPDAVADKAEAGRINDKEARANYGEYGATEAGLTAGQLDEGGALVADTHFMAAGGSIESDAAGNEIFNSKNNDATGDAIRTAESGDIRSDKFNPDSQIKAINDAYGADGGDYLKAAMEEHESARTGDDIPGFASISAAEARETADYSEARSGLEQSLAAASDADSRADIQQQISDLDSGHAAAMDGFAQQKSALESAYSRGTSEVEYDMHAEDSAYAQTMDEYRSRLAAAGTEAERSSINAEMALSEANHNNRIASLENEKQAIFSRCRTEAAERRDADISHIYDKVSEARAQIRQIGMNTAAVDKLAATSAIFGKSVSWSGSDEYMRSVIQGAFGNTIAKPEHVSSYTNIQVTSTAHGNELSYRDSRSGRTYLVIEKAAWMHRSSAEKQNFRKIHCADGVLRYTTDLEYSGSEKMFKSGKV